MKPKYTGKIEKDLLIGIRTDICLSILITDSL